MKRANRNWATLQSRSHTCHRYLFWRNRRNRKTARELGLPEINSGNFACINFPNAAPHGRVRLHRGDGATADSWINFDLGGREFAGFELSRGLQAREGDRRTPEGSNRSHPGGIKAISRGLSAATSPEHPRNIPPQNPRIRQGCQRARFVFSVRILSPLQGERF